MINIPGIPAKYEKSSDLYDFLKIKKSSKKKNFEKRDSLWEPKTLCGKHFWKIKISLRKAEHHN